MNNKVTIKDLVSEKNIRNEFLILVDKEESPTFHSLCSSVDRLNEFITSNSDLKIDNNKISIQNGDKYHYLVRKGKVNGKEQLFYYITVEKNDENLDLVYYKSILREIKKTLFLDKGIVVEVLSDGLSFYFSDQAYKLIYYIENMMRKLITYFMIIKVGRKWIDNSTPYKIKEALKKSKRRNYTHVLQKLDFIQLGDYLFKPYQDSDSEKLFEMIELYSEDVNKNLCDLQEFVPKSNWDRYFKGIVDCEGQNLENKWKKLYEKRNIVAHTSSLTEGEYLELSDLVSDIDKLLQEAFKKIDSIILTNNQKELLTQKIAIISNKDIEEYITCWNILEKNVRSLIPYTNSTFIEVLKYIEDNRILDQESIDQILQLSEIKNALIYDISIDDDKVYRYSQDIVKVSKRIKKDSWKFEVYNAFSSIGGTVTLKQLYKYIEVNAKRQLTASWQSMVRKTIYHNSSDTDIFLGNDDLFEQVSSGKWKLRMGIVS